MTETTKRGIFVLIKSALTGEALPLPEGFQLEQVRALAVKHQIQNLIYYGAVNCGIDRGSAVMRELFSATCRYLYIDERQRWELEKLYGVFDENGISYLPLKGVVLKSLYPRPDMRIMGDADILIRVEQYDKIRQLMIQLGFTEKVESDHELIWTKPSLYLELHKRVIPSYNHDYAAYFGDGWRLAQPGEPENRFRMSREDNLIYLLTHFAKHYRDGGIGIRHLTDLYVYRRAYPQLDEAYVKAELGKLQLVVFYENVCRTIAVLFETAEETKETALITQMILGSGVYGSEEGHIAAQGVRDKAYGKTAKQVRSKHWRQLVFLPYQDMCKKYPLVEKCALLLPVMWIVRWVQALTGKQQNIRNQRRRMKIMTAQRIDSYEQALRAVGLAFNFKE